MSPSLMCRLHHCLFMVLLFGLLAGCANLAPTSDMPTVYRDQRYTPADWPQALYADVHLPAGSEPHPVVLTVHGGGWEGRERSDMERLIERLVNAGYAVVNVDYRFAPEYTFPAQLHDLQRAMRWIHGQSEEFGLDTDRIAALGYSSGAHLVSLLAVVATAENPLGAPHGGPSTRPDLVIAGGTPADLDALVDSE